MSVSWTFWSIIIFLFFFFTLITITIFVSKYHIAKIFYLKLALWACLCRSSHSPFIIHDVIDQAVIRERLRFSNRSTSFPLACLRGWIRLNNAELERHCDLLGGIINASLLLCAFTFFNRFLVALHIFCPNYFWLPSISIDRFLLLFLIPTFILSGRHLLLITVHILSTHLKMSKYFLLF